MNDYLGFFSLESVAGVYDGFPCKLELHYTIIKHFIYTAYLSFDKVCNEKIQ